MAVRLTKDYDKQAEKEYRKGMLKNAFGCTVTAPLCMAIGVGAVHHLITTAPSIISMQMLGGITLAAGGFAAGIGLACLAYSGYRAAIKGSHAMRIDAMRKKGHIISN